jgi:hypothetical protein
MRNLVDRLIPVNLTCHREGIGRHQTQKNKTSQGKENDKSEQRIDGLSKKEIPHLS